MRYKDFFSWLVALPLGLNFVFMHQNGAKFFNFSDYYIFTVLVAIASLCYILTNRIYHHSSTSVFLYLSPIVIVILSRFFKPYQSDAFSAYLMFFITIFALSFVSFSQKQLNFLTNAYILSAVILSCILLIQRRLPYDQYGMIRYAIYYTEYDFYDVNFTGTYLLVPALLSFCEFIKGKQLYLMATIIIGIAMLMTVSRGALVPFMVVIFYKLLKSNRIRIGHILIIFMLVVCFILFTPSDIYNRLFAESYASDGSNQKRLLDWLAGIKVFLKSPIFGSGMIDTHLLTTQIASYTTAHNSFLVWLINFGILGFTSVVSLLVHIGRQLRQISDIYLIYLALLFSVFMIEANLSMVLLAPITYFIVVTNID